MGGVSVLITAYQSDAFLDDCIGGFLNQKTRIPYEILIAIDGCKETLKKAKEFEGVDVYYTSKNVGSFKNRNALVSKAKYDNLLFFDSDDIPTKNIIQKVFVGLKRNDVFQFMFYNFKEFGFFKQAKDYANGVFGINKNVFLKENGFHDGRFGMDSEFIFRLQQKRYKFRQDKSILFYRRLHGNNLTLSKDTGLGTPARIKVQKKIRADKANRTLTNPLELSVSNIIKVQ